MSEEKPDFSSIGYEGPSDAGFQRPVDADERPEAICPWCGVRIREIDLRFDGTPVPATLMLTWRCKNCQRLHGHQVVPAFWVIANAGIEGVAGGQNLSEVIANLRKPKA